MMKNIALLVIVAVLCLTAPFIAASTQTSPTPRTLIYYTTPTFKTDYSTFIASLVSKHHLLHFVNPSDDVSQLKTMDKLAYENIFVFCGHLSSESLQGFPNTAQFSQFVENGGSLWVAPVDGVLSETFRGLTLQYGVEYLPSTTQLIDLANPQQKALNVPLPAINSYILNTHTTDQNTTAVTLFGLPMYTVDNINYVKRVISGTPTTMAVDMKTKHVYETGENLSLLTAIQLKQNQRMVLMSDVRLLSNEVLHNKSASNYQTFVEGVACWVTHDCGYLRIKTLQHYMFTPAADLEETNPYVFTKQRIIRNNIDSLYPRPTGADVVINPKAYKVGEHVHFDVVLEQYNPYTKQWELTTNNDLVFDATCLHSHMKFPVEPTHPMIAAAKKNSVLQNKAEADYNMPLEMTMPDHMGVFKISLSTDAAFPHTASSGATFLSPNVEKQMTINVRPFAHDEWPKYAFGSYPYYAGMAVTMIASFVFAIAFLYTK